MWEKTTAIGTVTLILLTSISVWQGFNRPTINWLELSILVIMAACFAIATIFSFKTLRLRSHSTLPAEPPSDLSTTIPRQIFIVSSGNAVSTGPNRRVTVRLQIISTEATELIYVKVELRGRASDGGDWYLTLENSEPVTILALTATAKTVENQFTEEQTQNVTEHLTQISGYAKFRYAGELQARHENFALHAGRVETLVRFDATDKENKLLQANVSQLLERLRGLQQPQWGRYRSAYVLGRGIFLRHFEAVRRTMEKNQPADEAMDPSGRKMANAATIFGPALVECVGRFLRLDPELSRERGSSPESTDLTKEFQDLLEPFGKDIVSAFLLGHNLQYYAMAGWEIEIGKDLTSDEWRHAIGTLFSNSTELRLIHRQVSNVLEAIATPADIFAANIEKAFDMIERGRWSHRAAGRFFVLLDPLFTKLGEVGVGGGRELIEFFTNVRIEEDGTLFADDHQTDRLVKKH